LAIDDITYCIVTAQVVDQGWGTYFLSRAAPEIWNIAGKLQKLFYLKILPLFSKGKW